MSQVPNDHKLQSIDEFNDALDRNGHHLTSEERTRFRDIAKELYFYWLAMASYDWTFEQAVTYLDSGLPQYN